MFHTFQIIYFVFSSNLSTYEQRIIGEFIYKPGRQSWSQDLQANLAVYDQFDSKPLRPVWIQFLLDCPIITERKRSNSTVVVILNIYELSNEIRGNDRIRSAHIKTLKKVINSITLNSFKIVYLGGSSVATRTSF